MWQTAFNSVICSSARMTKAPFTLLRFCTKTERKISVFVKVFTLICTKTPQKRRFSKTLSKVNIHKNRGFWKRFWSMWTHKNGGFWKRSNIQQWASQKWSNVNAQKRMFFAAFLLSGRSVWTHKKEVFLFVFVQKQSSVNGSFDATKTDTNKNGIVCTGPKCSEIVNL